MTGTLHCRFFICRFHYVFNSATFLPHDSLRCPSISTASATAAKESSTTTEKPSNKKANQTRSPQNGKKLYNGTEYVKEKNYVYKRVYKNGELIKEERLAPTILESKRVKKENIPQFSTLKKDAEEK